MTEKIGLLVDGYANSFWCVRDGSVLGSYSTGAWAVNRLALADSLEQVIVSLHERLHHELQHSSPWGLMTEMSARLAASLPGQRDRLSRVARVGRDASRTTHEAFATGHSIGSDSRRLEWLAKNEPYQQYYDLAAALVSGVIDDRRFLFDALVRCAMAPPRLEHLLGSGLEGLRVRDLADGLTAPDVRLERLISLAPSLTFPSEPAAADIEQLSHFHDAVSKIVRAAGLPVLSTEGIRDCFSMIIESVARLDPALRGRLEIDVIREPILDDLEESQRERIVLRRDRGLPFRAVGPDIEGTRLLTVDAKIGPFVALIWVKTSVLIDQFDVDLDDLAGASSHVLAMVVASKEGDEVAAVEGLVVDGAGGPDELARHMGTMRCMTITTATSLFDAPGTATSEHVPVLYALIDAPVLHQLEHTFGNQASVEWDSFDIRPGAELCVTVFEVGALPGIRWIHLSTIAGRSYLYTWLESLPSGKARRVSDRFAEARDEIDVVATFITSTWRHLSMVDA